MRYAGLGRDRSRMRCRGWITRHAPSAAQPAGRIMLQDDGEGHCRAPREPGGFCTAANKGCLRKARKPPWSLERGKHQASARDRVGHAAWPASRGRRPEAAAAIRPAAPQQARDRLQVPHWFIAKATRVGLSAPTPAGRAGRRSRRAECPPLPRRDLRQPIGTPRQFNAGTNIQELPGLVPIRPFSSGASTQCNKLSRTSLNSSGIAWMTLDRPRFGPLMDRQGTVIRQTILAGGEDAAR